MSQILRPTVNINYLTWPSNVSRTSVWKYLEIPVLAEPTKLHSNYYTMISLLTLIVKHGFVDALEEFYLPDVV